MVSRAVLLKVCLSPALDLSVEKKDGGDGLAGGSRDDASDNLRDGFTGSAVVSVDLLLL